MKLYIVLTIFLVGANAFAMERSRSGNEKLEIQVLFEKLEAQKFEELKEASLKLNSYQNHEINGHGNTFAMQILSQYEDELQSGKPEYQIALLDIFDMYLKDNYEHISRTHTNFKNETFNHLLDRVKKMDPHIQSSKMSKIRGIDFLDTLIVFQVDKFEEFKRQLKDKPSQPEEIKTKRAQSKRGLTQWLKQKQEIESKQEEQFGVDFRKANQRRSLSDTNINGQENVTKINEIKEFKKQPQQAIIDPRVINWFIQINEHVSLINDKMSKILQKYFLEEEFEKLSKELSNESLFDRENSAE